MRRRLVEEQMTLEEAFTPRNVPITDSRRLYMQTLTKIHLPRVRSGKRTDHILRCLSNLVEISLDPSIKRFKFSAPEAPFSKLTCTPAQLHFIRKKVSQLRELSILDNLDVPFHKVSGTFQHVLSRLHSFTITGCFSIRACDIKAMRNLHTLTILLNPYRSNPGNLNYEVCHYDLDTACLMALPELRTLRANHYIYLLVSPGQIAMLRESKIVVEIVP